MHHATRLRSVEAARAHGAKDWRIILKYIIPNAIGPIIVQATLDMSTTILTIAALSFIGLGIQSPTRRSFKILKAVVVFPAPVSPTSPSVSPFFTVKF